MKKGDRVHLTKEAIRLKLGGSKRKYTGVITGRSRDKRLIHVRRDGDTDAALWSAIFWENAKP